MKKLAAVFGLTTLALAACDNNSGGADSGGAASSARGVTADSITLGIHTDLSGPVAAWGVGTVNGQRLRYDEVNAAGGVHGRKIKFVVEDTHYQVPTAVKAANKLINVEDIFLMVGALGTPPNNAVLPKQLKAGVPNLFPLTAAVQMYEPLHPMKFSYFVSYRDQIRAAMKHLAGQTANKKTCLQAVASDYGAEVELGFTKGAEENDLEVVYTGKHKPSESDFTGTVTSIKNSGCELLVLGPLIKDAILLYTSARAAGWNGIVVSNMVPYTSQVAKAADGKMEGFYAVSQLNLPNFEEEAKNGSWVGKWYNAYKAKFNEEPNVQSEAGYIFGDLVVKALEQAGPELTADKVLKALESIKEYKDGFGGPSVSFSATKHQGGDSVNLYQVRNSRWALAKAELPY